MSIKTAVLTVSDRCSSGLSEDKSGPLVSQYLTSKGFLVVEQTVVPDERDRIRVIIDSNSINCLLKVFELNNC